MLTTEVLQGQVHTITVRFLDTYTGTAKGDHLTFVGSNFDYVVTFGQLGNTVVTFVTRPDSIAHAEGVSLATSTGTKKMPPPMTFETTIAAASNGPRRRRRV